MSGINLSSFDVIFPMVTFFKLSLFNTYSWGLSAQVNPNSLYVKPSLGWIFREFKLMSSDAVKYFEDFIFLVSLPALIFRELAQFHLDQVDLAFLAASVIGMCVIYVLAVILCYPFARRQLKGNPHGSLLAISQAAIDGINAGIFINKV